MKLYYRNIKRNQSFLYNALGFTNPIRFTIKRIIRVIYMVVVNLYSFAHFGKPFIKRGTLNYLLNTKIRKISEANLHDNGKIDILSKLLFS